MCKLSIGGDGVPEPPRKTTYRSHEEISERVLEKFARIVILLLEPKVMPGKTVSFFLAGLCFLVLQPEFGRYCCEPFTNPEGLEAISVFTESLLCNKTVSYDTAPCFLVCLIAWYELKR